MVFVGQIPVQQRRRRFRRRPPERTPPLRFGPGLVLGFASDQGCYLNLRTKID